MVFILFGIQVLYQICVLRIFPPSLWTCLFILLTVIFVDQKSVILMKSSLPVFSFTNHAFGVIAKNSVLNQSHVNFLWLYLLKVLLFGILHLGVCSILSCFLWKMYGQALDLFLCKWVSSCLAPFAERTALSPLFLSPLLSLGCFWKSS